MPDKPIQYWEVLEGPLLQANFTWIQCWVLRPHLACARQDGSGWKLKGSTYKSERTAVPSGSAERTGQNSFQTNRRNVAMAGWRFRIWNKIKFPQTIFFTTIVINTSAWYRNRFYHLWTMGFSCFRGEIWWLRILYMYVHGKMGVIIEINVHSFLGQRKNDSTWI